MPWLFYCLLLMTFFLLQLRGTSMGSPGDEDSSYAVADHLNSIAAENLRLKGELLAALAERDAFAALVSAVVVHTPSTECVHTQVI